jgi:hypothetical protein
MFTICKSGSAGMLDGSRACERTRMRAHTTHTGMFLGSFLMCDNNFNFTSALKSKSIYLHWYALFHFCDMWTSLWEVRYVASTAQPRRAAQCCRATLNFKTFLNQIARSVDGCRRTYHVIVCCWHCCYFVVLVVDILYFEVQPLAH